MARSKAQQEAARKTGLSNAGTLANAAGSPITPRRRHLLDQLAAEQRRYQVLLAQNAKITEKNANLVTRIDNLSRTLHNTMDCGVNSVQPRHLAQVATLADCGGDCWSH